MSYSVAVVATTAAAAAVMSGAVLPPSPPMLMPPPVPPDVCAAAEDNSAAVLCLLPSPAPLAVAVADNKLATGSARYCWPVPVLDNNRWSVELIGTAM